MKKILVTEDNPDNMKLTRWVLEDAGYEVVGAESAEEALAFLDEETVDLVLMDISLPGMDGTEATRYLRRDPRFASVPIVALTAHAFKEEEQAIRACGFTDVLIKPVEEVQLEELVADLLCGEILCKEC